MLKELTIENYKSLRNVTIQFRDGLNIVIGKNGSGKSNLLEFIDTNANLRPLMAYERNPRFPSDYKYIFSYEQEQKIIEITFEVHSIYYIIDNQSRQQHQVSISWRHENENNPFSTESFFLPYETEWTTLNNIIMQLRPIGRFYIKLIEFNIPYRILWLDLQASFTLNNNGLGFYNLEREFDNFSLTFLFGYFFEKKLNENKSIIQSGNLIENMRSFLFESFDIFNIENSINKNLKLYSLIEEIRIVKNINIYNIDNKILIDYLIIEFMLDGKWMPWSYLSDGTKRLFYLITEMCCQDSGLILIEEPELGIHPHQLYKLMNFIKEQSRDKQIIISTHSPIVLDILNPDELDRITIAKIENGSTQFHKLTDEQMNKAKEYMHEVSDLSYYWLHSDLEGND